MQADPARGRRGFTLVELLAVIAVIALLAALLLPAVKNAQAAGKAAVCKGYQRQVVAAEFMFAGDNDGWLLVGSLWNSAGYYWTDSLTGGSAARTSTDPQQDVPAIEFHPYLDKSKALLCPGWYPFTYVGGESAFGFNITSLKTAANKTNWYESVPYRVTYRDATDDPANGGGGLGQLKWALLSGAARPAQMIMFADSVRPLLPTTGAWTPPDQAQNFSLIGTPGAGSNDREAHLRHKDKGNFSFWDGHVDTLEDSQLVAMFPVPNLYFRYEDLSPYPRP